MPIRGSKAGLVAGTEPVPGAEPVAAPGLVAWLMGDWALSGMLAILKKSRRDEEVERGGYLERPSIAGDDAHVPTSPLNQTGVIGGRASTTGMGVLEHLPQEPLRGLNATQRLALRSRQHAALCVDHLDRVGHRKAWHHGGMAGPDGSDDPVEQIRRRQAASDIVNQDDPVFVPQGGQSRLHRSRPVHPAWHDVHLAVISEEPGGSPALVDMGARGHDDDVSHLRATKSAPQCVSQ